MELRQKSWLGTHHALAVTSALGLFGLVACEEAYYGTPSETAPNTGAGPVGEVVIGEGEGEAGDDEVANPTPNPEPGQLTAAEWRDLEDWELWLSLYGEGRPAQEQPAGPLAAWRDTWGLHAPDRFSVRVVADGAAAADAAVTLWDGDGVRLFEARTDNHGRAELFAPPIATELVPSYRIEVVRGQTGAVLEDVEPTGAELPLFVDLSGSEEEERLLDLMFVVDTTGSMSDELSFLQAELGSVIERVDDNVEEDFDLRMSLNFYRDHGESYVVKSSPFTTDREVALAALDGERAVGGGDWPEAVEEALEEAVYGHAWSPDARARLLFLVLDAPPHHDASRMISLRETVREAARLGVRIIPVAASGTDRGTESLLRQMDVLTGATYVFLTDDSGIGNDHLEPITGPVEVELLDDLLVRLIQDAIE